MRVGAIDIGTNSVHLLVAEVAPDGDIRIVDSQRRQVELGAGGLDAHHIQDGPFAAGVDALRHFRETCDLLAVEDVVAVATSAVREADNGHAFCDAVRDATGMHVRVIAGGEEARLIYLGARGDLDFSGGRALLVDVGGGSTEFVLCDVEQPLVLESLPLGHIRLADRFLRADPLAESERVAMRDHVRRLLQPLKARVRPSDLATVVATSGGLRTIARIATAMRGEALPTHGHGLIAGRAEIEELIRTFRTRPSATWDKIPGFDPKRRRTLPAAAILAREILKAVDKDRYVTSVRSLRDGLLVDWMLRHRPELALSGSVSDPRRRSVMAAMERFGADRAHSLHVADLALRLFDALAAVHRLSADDRRLLEFAALLHDIGHHISTDDHHLHSAYLVRHVRLGGFVAPDIAVLANIVRYHRGHRPKVRHAEFGALSHPDRQRVRVLAGILAIADALDRGHDQSVVDVQVRPHASDTLEVVATSRVAGDLVRWAAARRTEALEIALDRRIFVTVPSADPAADFPA